MKRLTNKDRQQLIDEIRQDQADRTGKKTVGMQDSYWLWFKLAYDHYRRLKSILHPLEGFPGLEDLAGCNLTSCRLSEDFRESEYAKHYDDAEIGLLLSSIKSAQKSLSWLESILVAEKLRRTGNRASKRSKVVSGRF